MRGLGLWFARLFPLLILSVAPACGSDSDGDAPACEAGRTLSCACPGGGDTGVQTCASDGGGWSSCDCGSGGTGGSAASGGTGATTNGGSSGSGASGSGAASSGGSATGGAGGNATGGAAGTSGNGCPTGRGSEMVRIAHPMGDYCIDKTEATKGQYAEFRAAMDGDYSGQPDYCSWNTDYSQGSCGSYSPNGNPNLPAGCMDWCDADQFCRWAGKRLCGKLGGGNIVPNFDSADGEWSLSCTGSLPLQNQADCHSAAWEPQDVLETTQCVGATPPFSDLTYLLGNAYEWIHSCTGGDFGGGGAENASSDCYARGGSYETLPEMLSCDLGDRFSRTHSRSSIGVRCCASPN